MTPDVKALQEAIEAGIGEGEELSYFGANGNVDPKFTAGRQATAALLQHVERMTKALEFYAHSRTYEIDPLFKGRAIFDDRGQRAREALAPTATAPGGEEVG